jgi:hypothetical protein
LETNVLVIAGSQPLAAVIVIPSPLSEAKLMVHPALTLEIAGRVTVIDAPLAL